MSMPVPGRHLAAMLMPTILSSFWDFLDEARAEDVLIGRSVRLGLGLGATVATSNLTTAWYLSAAASARTASPCPFA